jgi:hypothetical protein
MDSRDSGPKAWWNEEDVEEDRDEAKREGRGAQ